MKQVKNVFRRTIPVILIIVVTMALSYEMCRRMIRSETEKCWESLYAATQSISEKMNDRFGDNINFLSLVSDAIVLHADTGEDGAVLEYLKHVENMTIFDRFDILFPDGRILKQNGEYEKAEEAFSYDELVKKGKYVSTRYFNPSTGKEEIYCLTPIQRGGEDVALLIGTLECKHLPELFPVFLYGGKVQVFLVDREDGNILMDNWHTDLGHVSLFEEREIVNGYEEVDFVSEIMEGKTGRVAFLSRTNGKPSYMCYVPVTNLNWELCIAVQDSEVFENVYALRKFLIRIGIVETVILLIYFGWNVFVTYKGIKSEEKARKWELDRATNEAKSKFLSNMSHDIRTPLNGIVGTLEMIKQRSEDEEFVKECLYKIDVSTQYLITLANDMLDINELESGKLVIEEKPMDIRQLASGLGGIIMPRVRAAEISYSMNYSRVKHPYVLGSQVHIQRILVNLLVNAIKYNKKNGNIWVSIEEEETEEGYGFYRFEVQDTGIGMSEEFQKNMYDAFEQEQGGARSVYQGYGLGLTIVKHLVQKMHGEIQLKSKKGEGSTFIVILPLKYDEKQVYTQEEQQESDQEDHLSGKRILLVEDNELNMEIAEFYLSSKGAVVTKAENGRIAVDLFAETKENSFDLILMDIMMPELDGCEATREIRAMDRMDAKKIPIIAMTANAFVEEVDRCREAGMNDHISKPLDMNVLMQELVKIWS